ncbi:hypothetical protein vseg_008100 [Gypsophila vaccaria]
MHSLRTTLNTHLVTFVAFILTLPFTRSSTTCRDQCGTIPIHYPFGIDDGCGAPQFRTMFTCNTSSQALFFTTPNGNFKVQSIDYPAQTVTVYDPDMSTCTILQPPHGLKLSDIQYAVVPPSPDTVFALLNCSLDSPVLNRYRSLCFDVAGHKCAELYSSCNSFRVFTDPALLSPGIPSNYTGPNGYFYAGGTNNNYNYNYNYNNNSGGGGGMPPPPCCFTGYSTMKVMSMDILDCTHYTSFYNADKLEGVGPMDWSYGLKFSYSMPDMGCQRCMKSGGSCGFDSETEALMCLCSAAVNSTRQCGVGTDMDSSEHWIPYSIITQLLFISFGFLFV